MSAGFIVDMGSMFMKGSSKEGALVEMGILIGQWARP